MQIEEAISLIEAGVPKVVSTWVDIGAGTGMFTQALDGLLPAGSTIIALDKSPHPLYYLRLQKSRLQVEDGDFERPLSLPMLDGIVMANALHCTADPKAVLENVLPHLRPRGHFVLVEYERETPIIPWIPYPIPRGRFAALAAEVGLSAPVPLGEMPSAYGRDQIYALGCHRIN